MDKTSDKKKANQPRSRGKGASRVYAKLREDILRLELPPGELLDEVEIGKQFSLSRSPVREAFIRLSAEGLVKTLPNKSTLVAPLNIEEFSQYIDALDLMQRAATRLAAKMRTDEDVRLIKKQITRFDASLSQSDALAMIETNRDLHVSIAEAGKNSYLTLFYTRLLDDGRRLQRLYFRSFDDKLPPRLAEEHYELLSAIEDRDEDRAEHLAHLHTVHVSDQILSSLGARFTEDISVHRISHS